MSCFFFLFFLWGGVRRGTLLPDSKLFGQAWAELAPSRRRMNGSIIRQMACGLKNQLLSPDTKFCIWH